MRALHPIRYVAQRTGLSTHIIRIWERRYQAVIPVRTDSGRRVYSDAEIERLKLLKEAVDRGESIGQVAGLSNEELQVLSISDLPVQSTANAFSEVGTLPVDPAEYVAAAGKAILDLDIHRLESILLEAEVSLSQPIMLEQFLAPLLKTVGRNWAEGSLRIVNEHMATAAIRTALGRMLSAHPISPSAPWIVVTTPSGQLHEMGAMLAALAAASGGWNVAYLGPNLPAEEIVGGMRRFNSSVVALSIVYPIDDPRLIPELQRLRQMAGADASVIVGGQMSSEFRNRLQKADCSIVSDLRVLSRHLQTLHKSPGSTFVRRAKTE